jgi:diguanylate cyclase (GGDEF)-like protein
MLPVSVVAIVSFLPFTVNNFLQRHYALGAVMSALMLIFAVNAAAIVIRRAPPIPFVAVLLFIVPSVALSLQVQGIYGAFWCYPVVLFFHFALPRRAATYCSIVLLVAATAMVFLYVDAPTGIRFFVSLLLTTIVLNIFLNVIASLERRLVEQSIRDPLTGAFNRRHLDECLRDALERRGRTGAPASLLALDLDHFKSINDRFGHGTGDRVLQGVVLLVRDRCRRLDRLFRAGGEEFVLLLPDTRAADAQVLAEQLRDATVRAPLLDGTPLSVSIGVAELRADESAAEWLERADRCLYRAKHAGRNCVVADDTGRADRAARNISDAPPRPPSGSDRTAAARRPRL